MSILAALIGLGQEWDLRSGCLIFLLPQLSTSGCQAHLQNTTSAWEVSEPWLPKQNWEETSILLKLHFLTNSPCPKPNPITLSYNFFPFFLFHCVIWLAHVNLGENWDMLSG